MMIGRGGRAVVGVGVARASGDTARRTVARAIDASVSSDAGDADVIALESPVRAIARSRSFERRIAHEDASRASGGRRDG